MKSRMNMNHTTRQRWGLTVLCALMVAIVAACSGSQPTPTATVVPTAAPTTATTPAPADTPGDEEAEEVEAEDAEADAAEATQPESPLSQPESPLAQPESPLTTTPLTAPRTEEEAIALAATTTAPEPGEGLGSVAGVVYSFGTVPGAIRGTQVYLEAALEQDGQFMPPPVSLGPSLEEGDIIVETNDLGQLYIEVPPGNYYAAVWTPYDWRLVVSAVGEEAPRLITVEEGDQLDLGVLYAYWP
jgi:hypothetical protein